MASGALSLQLPRFAELNRQRFKRGVSASRQWSGE
jgi:hypothetical protein